MNQSSNAMASAPHVIPPLPKPKGGPRGGIHDPFPIKFYRMLDRTRDEGSESIVSWLSHGRAFKIHKPKAFAATVMPRFFNQSKYTSFQRQLNLYGFTRCCRGRDAGAYHHPLFLRGRPDLLPRILRTKIKGNGHKTSRLHETEPDFYAMPPLDHVGETPSLSDASSVGSFPSLEQPTVAAPSTLTLASTVGRGPSKPSFPPPSLPLENLGGRRASYSSEQFARLSDFAMKLHEMEPNFHAMALLKDVQETSSLGDASSVDSLPSLEQPTVVASTVTAPSSGCGLSKPSLPSSSLRSGNLGGCPAPSSGEQVASPSNFVNDLNKSIFIHASSAGRDPSTPNFPSSSLRSGNLGSSPASSSGEPVASPSDFVNELNRSIFVHELAMGCTILCQLRRDTNLL